MIKAGIINFVKSLKYYLTPLGAIALAIVIGLAIFIPCCIDSITRMLDSIGHIFGDINYNWAAANDALISDVSALDWAGDFFNSLTSFLDSGFLNHVLEDVIIAAFGRGDISKLVVEALDTCGKEITIQVAIFLVILVLGIVVGFLVTRMQVRHDIASLGYHHPWRFILRLVLDILILVGNIVLIIWLNSIWNTAAMWAVIIGVILLYAIVTIFKAYFVYGLGYVSLAKALNLREILAIIIADVVILALGIALIALLFYLVNMIVAIIVGIPFLLLTIIVMDLNADSYMKKYQASDYQ